MGITELKRQAEALLSQMSCGKEYIIGQVSQRLAKAAVDNPQDTVIRAVAGVMDRMARHDPTRTISQAEIEAVYNELVGLDSSGTRFREVLGELLLTAPPASVVPNEQFAQTKDRKSVV